MSSMNNWRGCNKCSALFFDGFPNNPNTICAAGGLHRAQSFNFQLPFNVPENDHAQANWRGCRKCSALFFDGSPNNPNTKCAAGGRHEQQSENFVLPHDIPGSAVAQAGWRGCNKCSALFFDGFPNNPNTACPGGGNHVAQGFQFVLPHWITPTVVLSSRFDSDGAEHIFVTGRGFSPLNEVAITHSYRRLPSTLTQGPQPDVNTDNSGDFSDEIGEDGEIRIPANAINVTITATDRATGTTVTSNVLRPTI